MNLLLAFNGTCLNGIKQITTANNSQKPSRLDFPGGNSGNSTTTLAPTASAPRSRAGPRAPARLGTSLSFETFRLLQKEKRNHEGISACCLPPPCKACPLLLASPKLQPSQINQETVANSRILQVSK